MITAEEARRLFEYDPETGVLTNRVDRCRAKKGVRAGSEETHQNGKKYRRVDVCGYSCYEHRLVWLIVHGEYPQQQIDHVDGDGTNNRLSNLRQATCSVNARNRKKPRTNTTGTVGVYYDPVGVKWWAEIWEHGRKKYLGRFTNIDDAIRARKDAEKRFGYHENHGKDRRY